jgi:RHS repeat-associated protein
MSGSDPAPGVQGETQPNYTYTFYGITGQRLATLNCNGSNYPAYPNCTITGQNVYYGKKLIVSGGVAVVTDRLGSVRADTQGESFAYYPYGEERTATPDGRNKFATYFRDTIGQDYADQRYYNAGIGRFWNVDPDGGSGDASVPLTWNRYSYANGDPVNHWDPSGLDGVCGPYATWMGEGCYTTGGSPPSGGAYGCNDDWDTFGEGCDMGDDAGVGCSGGASGFLGSPGPPGCDTGGGGDGPSSSAPPPTITLQEINDCIQPHGTGINPGTWTLFVEYQVLVNGKPVYSNSALNNLGITITESVTKTSGNIDIVGGQGWCPLGGNCGTNAGTMNSSGDFWDMLAGQGTANQSFLYNGQPIAVSFSGGSQTVLKNSYNSNGHQISVGGGALVGNSKTRECGKSGDPGRN